MSARLDPRALRTAWHGFARTWVGRCWMWEAPPLALAATRAAQEILAEERLSAADAVRAGAALLRGTAWVTDQRLAEAARLLIKAQQRWLNGSLFTSGWPTAVEVDKWVERLAELLGEQPQRGVLAWLMRAS